uniref:Uncharacterized protein n=1 Tax=Solanum lycopersicum TaxID=4081 RepID=A0A3Q7IHL5_SOLLC
MGLAGDCWSPATSAGATGWIVVLAVALCSELLCWCPAAAGCWNSPLGAVTRGR